MTTARSPGGQAAVVCLHGLGRMPSDWDGVRSELERFGRVDAPLLPRDPAGALAAADSAVGAGAVVIGHSMGGVLALQLVRERPRPLRAIVLTGCFFPPARNGRGLSATIADYALHRVAFVRSAGRGDGAERSGGSARALASLVRLAARPGALGAGLAGVTPSVLVVHARDDHHVPVDFAVAAAARQPGWALEILEQGGHHAHVDHPRRWLGAVMPWLQALT